MRSCQGSCQGSCNRFCQGVLSQESCQERQAERTEVTAGCSCSVMAMRAHPQRLVGQVPRLSSQTALDTTEGDTYIPAEEKQS